MSNTIQTDYNTKVCNDSSGNTAVQKTARYGGFSDMLSQRVLSLKDSKTSVNAGSVNVATALGLLGNGFYFPTLQNSVSGTENASLQSLLNENYPDFFSYTIQQQLMSHMMQLYSTIL